MLDDLRIAFRSLSKSAGFASIAVVTLALGLGASTAIFSVVSGVLLKPLPYPDADRMLQVESVFPSGFIGRVSYPSFADLREQNRSFSELAAYAAWTTSATVAGEGFRVEWAQANSQLFGVVGVSPAMGRLFTAEEEQRGENFRRDGALVAGLWLPETRLIEGPGDAAEIRNVELVERFMERARALPGVERVGAINILPLDGGGANGTFVILDRPDEIATIDDFIRLSRQPERAGNAEFRVSSAEYFGAMSIPLVRGRLFDERDVRGAPHVAVISNALAESRWPGEDPLGKLIQFGNMDGDLTPITIVGIVGDVQDYGIGTRALPTFYVDFRQRPRTAAELKVVIFGSMDIASTAAAARRIATELDPDVPIAFRTLSEVVSASLADRRFMLLLLGVFGAVALALATMGVYGVVAYMAARRTAEIGVRVALGARRRDIERLLVKQGAVFALAGVALGLIAAFALTRFVASFLYGVGAADPAAFAAAGVALFAAAVIASWIPACRASRIDALVALRHE